VDFFAGQLFHSYIMTNRFLFVNFNKLRNSRFPVACRSYNSLLYLHDHCPSCTAP
jgi:hypothetical protein